MIRFVVQAVAVRVPSLTLIHELRACRLEGQPRPGIVRSAPSVESVSIAGSVMHTVTRKVITAPSPIIGEGRTQTADGVVVSTEIRAGGVDAQHCEGSPCRSDDARRPPAKPQRDARRTSSGRTSRIARRVAAWRSLRPVARMMVPSSITRRIRAASVLETNVQPRLAEHDPRASTEA